MLYNQSTLENDHFKEIIKSQKLPMTTICKIHTTTMSINADICCQVISLPVNTPNRDYAWETPGNCLLPVRLFTLINAEQQ